MKIAKELKPKSISNIKIDELYGIPEKRQITNVKIVDFPPILVQHKYKQHKIVLSFSEEINQLHFCKTSSSLNRRDKMQRFLMLRSNLKYKSHLYYQIEPVEQLVKSLLLIGLIQICHLLQTNIIRRLIENHLKEFLRVMQAKIS